MLKTSIIKFLNDEEGATAIEYGLIAGLIAALIVTTVSDIGIKISALFTKLLNALPTTAN